ncbi:glucosyltransferase [Lentzea sp. NBRC 105346]|uniref:glycosyltransferase n=1 Tax=Lentzea sp. NBRC 105346 TaxID=3032205 RepID=UPI0024A38001|nr:glycosyltransferase [Lentzea sp. NBRC 105346]GLZ28733.1 glucosyltransferase [Lentzea sp. NBRC 105346]
MIAILLAVLGAFCFAFAARLQHQAVDGAPRLATLKNKRWLAGLALLVTGAGVHAVALGMAPLTVIQPIGVLAIGITALLDGRTRELPAVAVTTLGVGGFVLLASGSATATQIAPDAELTAALIVLGLIAVPGLVAVLTNRPRTSAVAFATAGGVAYGFVSVLMRAVQQGPFGLSTVLTVTGIVIALIVGGWLVQHAYAGGPPHVAVACLTVVDPLVAVGIGALLLGEASRTSGWTAVAEITCALVAIGGVLALAKPSTRSELVVKNPAAATRIVIAADTFPPDVNGAARFAHRLAAGLASRGHDVHVLCPDTPRAEPLPGITVHRLRSHGTPFYRDFRVCLPWQTRAEIRALLSELQPDVLHSQAHFVVGRLALRQAKALGIPTVATNHFMPENLFGLAHVPRVLQEAASRWAYRDLANVFGAADIVTAPTPRAVQLLHDNGFPERAIPVSCGIDISRYRDRSARRLTDMPTALFVGRLDEEKRVDELLRALARVPGAAAEIVGDGTCRDEWELMARDLGITNRVRFHGFVDEETLLDAYVRCDLFVMPGIAELQSLATMEAMAAGKPVIAADAMALPHLVQPGRNGWLYPPGDVTALAERLHALVHDEPTRARMGAASEDLIARHAIAKTLDTFEELYSMAMGHEPLTPALAA